MKVLTGTTDGPQCPFCLSGTTPVYMMGKFTIYQCSYCKTGQVFPMPTNDEVLEFYKGFLFSANITNLEIIRKSAPMLFSSLGLPKNGSLKMLDVGGGGGFYAKAFEETGYGESTYVDLDNEACEFARNKVGVNNVLNLDAAMLESGDMKYDFIMCRHLIEHLINPTDFILKLTNTLTAHGTLLIVCPNGDALEYFAYPNLLKGRVKKIALANKLSKYEVMLKFMSGKMLHGIDPPRHLWAISRMGMQRFLDNNHIKAEIATFPLTDIAYSPYYSSVTFKQKVWSFLGDIIFSKIAGGTHLSVVIRKSELDSGV